MASSFFAKFTVYVIPKVISIKASFIQQALLFFFNINNIFAKITDPLMK